MTIDSFATAIQPWAERAQYYAIVDLGDSCQIASEPGGEIVYYVREKNGLYSISRGERSTQEYPYAWDLSEEDALRFMTAELGDPVRENGDLPPIWRSFDKDELPAGYELLSGGPGEERLSRGGLIIGWFKGNSIDVRAVAFAYISTLSIEAIQAIYLDPEGAEKIPHP